MADTGENTGETSPDRNDAPPPARGGLSAISTFMMANKVEAALWATRMFTLLATVLFILPVLGGNSASFYQRALLSNGATSALRLHQRLPHFQFSREFFGLLFIEDSAHYLFYSLIFLAGSPATMVLITVCLFALLHSATYTKQLLDQMGPDTFLSVRNLLTKLQSKQVFILRFIAINEIFLMPASILMAFSGQGSILLPFIYYRFLSLRYSSRRNPYSRTVFYELRSSVEHLCSQPQCPAFVSNIFYKAIAFISRLAPQTPV